MKQFLILYEDRFGRYAHGITSDPAHWKQLMVEMRASGEDEKKLRKRLSEARFLEVVP